MYIDNVHPNRSGAEKLAELFASQFDEVPYGEITTAAVTAAETTTYTTTTASTAAQMTAALYGDANCDGKVTISDAVTILQYIANKDKFPLTPEGMNNADVAARGDGITANDALAIQKLDAGIITVLPES